MMRPIPHRALGPIAAFAAGVALSACAGPGSTASPSEAAEPTASSSPTPEGTPTPSSDAAPLSQASLKYRLVDELGELWYCDPDEYPVARGDEEQLAAERIDEIRADVPTFMAIVVRFDLADRPPYTPDELLAIYREWKMLDAVVLEPGGEDGYTFDYLAQPPAEGGAGTRSTGSIDSSGVIDVDQQVASDAPDCPICLARGTLIATPRGPVAVEHLAVGDPVWTRDAMGRRVAAVVLRLGTTPVPDTHEIVSVRLDDGREVTASPGHPLADGRRLGDLAVGDRVGTARVTAVEVMRYDGGATFDLLPSGATGAYWAGEIPLSSTLRTEDGIRRLPPD